MIITTLHETVFDYASPVTATFTQARLHPMSDAGQTCHEFSFTVDPLRPLTETVDYFGNTMHTFNIMPAHRSVVVVGHSIVETHRNPFEMRQPLTDFERQKAQFDFVRFDGPIEDTPEVRKLAMEAGLYDAADPMEAMQKLNGLINERFAFAPQWTHVDSTIREVFAHGRGVCQDFAHVFLACCRSAGYPARYASGYLVTKRSLSAEGSPASHAWAEVLLPENGWTGFDPTNNLLANDYYVKVASGRDYRDVSPTRGSFCGKGIASRLKVRVHMQLQGADTETLRGIYGEGDGKVLELVG